MNTYLFFCNKNNNKNLANVITDCILKSIENSMTGAPFQNLIMKEAYEARVSNKSLFLRIFCF